LILESDKELIDDYIKSQSELSATKIVRKYQNFVYATALRYLQNYDDADDVAQEVFIKALKYLKNFRGDSSLKTWLYKITVNMVSSFKRKKKFYTVFSNEQDDEYLNIENDDISPLQEVENKEFETKLLKLLSTLPDKQRETFALRYFDNLSYEEISKLLGTSIGGLKANYFQAVKKIAASYDKIMRI
jgi:RNA polymerase sigma-70 factor, ECF subfamily